MGLLAVTVFNQSGYVLTLHSTTAPLVNIQRRLNTLRRVFKSNSDWTLVFLVSSKNQVITEYTKNGLQLNFFVRGVYG